MTRSIEGREPVLFSIQGDEVVAAVPLTLAQLDLLLGALGDRPDSMAVLTLRASLLRASVRVAQIEGKA